MPGPSTRVFVRATSWMLIFFSLAAAATAWLTPRPDLEADDAAEVAVGALEQVEVDAEVSGDIEYVRHAAGSGQEVDAWAVPMEVDGEEIELRVQQSVGAVVYVDDRIGADDAEFLLTDEQYDALNGYREDAVHDRWVRRNSVGVVAALAIAGVSFLIARRSGRIL